MKGKFKKNKEKTISELVEELQKISKAQRRLIQHAKIRLSMLLGIKIRKLYLNLHLKALR